MNMKSRLIADKIVEGESCFQCAIYAGKMFGKDLYGIKRNLTGHIGMPRFVLISDDGSYEFLENGHDILKAMKMEREYIEKHGNNT